MITVLPKAVEKMKTLLESTGAGSAVVSAAPSTVTPHRPSTVTPVRPAVAQPAAFTPPATRQPETVSTAAASQLDWYPVRILAYQ